MATGRLQTFVLYAILVSLVPLTIWLHCGFAIRLRDLTAAQVSFIPSAQAVRLVSLGYDQLIADFYWLAFISYIGDGAARAVDQSKLADQYLDLITGLDPHFVQPYWFCAFTVGSAEQRPLRANAIIQRGIRANPENWYLPYIAGINLYLFGHDEVAASKYYALSAKMPGSPSWMGRQARILASKIPSTIKEINAWDTIYRTEQSALIQKKAKEKLVALWSKVYWVSPKGAIRKKAAEALLDLGVSI